MLPGLQVNTQPLCAGAKHWAAGPRAVTTDFFMAHVHVTHWQYLHCIQMQHITIHSMYLKDRDIDIDIYIYVYIYIWSRVPCSYPSQWYGSPDSTPFPSICKLLAAFLRSSLVLARSLQHFWLPALRLLGTCYLLDDPRSTHTPSKYLRATYSHIYMCYVSTSYLLPV